MPEKKRNYLVTFYDTHQTMIKEPVSYIAKAENKNEAYELAVVTLLSLGLDENIIRLVPNIITRLSEVKRLDKKELTIQEAMGIISDPVNFEKSVQLFEKMMLNRKLNYNALLSLIAPYGEYSVNKGILEPDIQISSLWSTAIKSSDRYTKFCKLIFKYLPKNKSPFKHKDQIYEIWVSKNITFLHLNGNSEKYSFVELMIELKKIIPDLPMRLETVMIEAM